ncbi:hypothetical protein GCM10009765_56790 [Fodinicola feengrottensis]|uniref:Helix-turn-helix domain-containing protein n=1 Tax=Fodinicola feengrottensis TaxID=435914 RepID=A0ABP4U781_9ACTN
MGAASENGSGVGVSGADCAGVCADGAQNQVVARELGTRPQTVAKWRNRFVEAGLGGLSDEARPGRPRAVTDAQVENVIIQTLEHQPPDEGTHWSTRLMAKQVGMSQTAVSRVGACSVSNRTWWSSGSCPPTRSSWTRSVMWSVST